MEQLALGWLVYEMTDSPFLVGVSSAARMAPFFFLGILSGAIADRLERRLFLRFITLGAIVLAVAMAAVILAKVVQPTNDSSAWQVAIVIGLSVVSGCVWAFMMTVKQSYTYDIVGPQNSLNGLSLNAMSQRFGGIFGAVLSGLLIAGVGIGAQYLIVGLTYAASMLFLFFIRDVGQATPVEREPVIKNLVGYIKVLRENRTLRMLMILTAVTEVFGFTHQSLLPVFARDVLGVDSIGLGYMRAVQQFGGVLGLVVLANMGEFRRKGLLMFAVAFGFGVGQIALSVSLGLIMFLVVLAWINACASAVDTLYKMLMQANVSNEQRGRAMGSWVLSIGTAPIGHMSVGALAGWLGAPAAILFNGTVLALASLSFGFKLSDIRRL